ncbi:MAG: CvpA family protein [Pseudomonadota bacterium]
MNPFDAALLGTVLLLAILGFRAGLLRSLADILGFVVAAPIAVALMPYLSTAKAPATVGLLGQSSILFLATFLVAGFILAQLMRYAVAGMIGEEIHLLDRSAGLLLGIARALLVAVMLVLVFDRIIPAGRDPAFLVGSKSRPMLSLAAQHGVRSLPPEIAAHIDRLKRQKGL